MISSQRRHCILTPYEYYQPFPTRPFFKYGGATTIDLVETSLLQFRNKSEFVHLMYVGIMHDYAGRADCEFFIRQNSEIVSLNSGSVIFGRIPVQNGQKISGILYPNADVRISIITNSGAARDISIWIAGVYSKSKDEII